jgi:ATPase subunit of ABC transporter with duplicated ATPase domains
MKNWIYITNLSKWFADKILLNNVTLNFHPWDKIWIVWENWCGKTTFLRLIAWEIKSDSWWIWNKNSIAYMRQEIACKPETTVYDYLLNYIEHWEEYKIYPMLDEFWLDIGLDQKVGTLSWWEQKKLDLIAIILQKSDVLLLDEPTNHLDQYSLEMLQKFILEHKWIVLFVSHDRHFLNMMANKILELDAGKFAIFCGNYEDYKQEKERLYQRQLQDYAVFQKEKKKWDAWFADLRQRASVYVNPAWWRLLKSKEKYFQREVMANKVDKPVLDKNICLSVVWWTHQGKLIFKTDKFSLGFDNFVLIKDVEIEIRWKDRIQIIWENGSWKTTLIKTIVANLSGEKKSEFVVWNDIKFEYFDQKNQDLMSKESVYEWFRKNVKTASCENSIRSQLAMLWLSQVEIFSPMCDLSYGQRVKVKFLQMLSGKIDLLILDEPTNHLDISARESIEDMLDGYEWALIFVSHDQYFAEKIEITGKYVIRDNRLEKMVVV